MNADHPGSAVTSEIWLDNAPPPGAPFDVVQVKTRAGVQAGLADDPLSRGSLLALVVASLAGSGWPWQGCSSSSSPTCATSAASCSTSRRRERPPTQLRRHLRLRALMLVGMGLVGGIVPALC